MMACLALSRNDHRWFNELTPASLVLILTIALPFLLGEFTFLKGWQALYLGILRFIRITLLLCLPFYLLLRICGGLGWIARKGNRMLIQLKRSEELEIRPLKHWLLRPFQGIGIGLFFALKLLTVLQIVTGQKATASLMLPADQFQLGRLLATTGITILVSLLLSTVWTLDDLRIRYYNRKREEIKMIGKYIGTVVPVLLGFYGIISLFGEFQIKQSLIYLFQMVLILYPPFTVFSVLHTHFIQKRVELFSGKLSITKGTVLHEKEDEK